MTQLGPRKPWEMKRWNCASNSKCFRNKYRSMFNHKLYRILGSQTRCSPMHQLTSIHLVILDSQVLSTLSRHFWQLSRTLTSASTILSPTMLIIRRSIRKGNNRWIDLNSALRARWGTWVHPKKALVKSFVKDQVLSVNRLNQNSSLSNDTEGRVSLNSISLIKRDRWAIMRAVASERCQHMTSMS